MELKTKFKTIKLVFTTRKIVNLTNILKGKNFEELYFKIVNESDLDSLSKIIYAFAEDEAGIKSFIDDYKEENSKTYDDIFNEIAEAINEEGFFKSKMTKEEMEQKISNPLSKINTESIIKASAEKAVAQIVEKEILT